MVSSTAQAIPHERSGMSGHMRKSREHFEEVREHRRRHLAKMAEQKLNERTSEKLHGGVAP